MLGLGVNGGSTFGGVPIRHRMSGRRRVGQLHFDKEHVHGSNHNEIVLFWCAVIVGIGIY